MQQIADTKLLEAHITSCHEQADQFSETLMSLELQLVDQLEVRIKRPNAISITERMEVSQISFFFKDIFKDFERNISDMVGGFIEYVQGIYPLSNQAKQNAFILRVRLL